MKTTIQIIIDSEKRTAEGYCDGHWIATSSWGPRAIEALCEANRSSQQCLRLIFKHLQGEKKK